MLPVMTSAVSQKDIRVTAALMQAPSELSHLAVQTATPLVMEPKGKKAFQLDSRINVYPLILNPKAGLRQLKMRFSHAHQKILLPLFYI